MRMDRHFPETRREVQRDKSRGFGLLEQAGFIRSGGAAGIYSLLPLGFRTHRKVCDIIYREMEAAGVENLQLPILQTRDLWEETNRWSGYRDTKTMFVTKDWHSGAEFGLAPTAEELVTDHVRRELQSWRQLPLMLHQIGPKFRDELRPRGGLLRTREFVMSDAYSFDLTRDAMRETYELFRVIYQRIFEAVGLPQFIAVQADSGAIGGSGSAEFMALSEVGEDTLLTCTNCDFGANVEKAPAMPPAYERHAAPEGVSMTTEETPGVRTVEELQVFFPAIPESRMLKTIIFSVDEGLATERLVACCIRGDLEIQEVKLQNCLVATTLEGASPEQVREATAAEVGFAGPIGLERVSEIVFDESAADLDRFLCGVNQTDRHAINVRWDVDLPRPAEFASVAAAEAGFACPSCDDGVLQTSRGVEIGHIFMLQKKYSDAMKVTVPDADGQTVTPWMGCYGIGTTRLLQAVAEQSNDDQGLIWPAAISPYRAHIVVAGRAEEALGLGEEIYQLLGRDALLDTRPLSAGVKFADADLIGIPTRITVGRRSADRVVEVRDRRTGEVVEFEVGDLVAMLAAL